MGITAIEIAEGEAPYAGLDAMKILLSIMNSSPPSLNRANWSPEFLDFVDKCLQKDSTKRPSAEELLKTDKFINQALDETYLEANFLHDFPPLKDRIASSLILQG